MMPGMPWTLILSAVATATSLVAIFLVLAGNRITRQVARRETELQQLASTLGMDDHATHTVGDVCMHVEDVLIRDARKEVRAFVLHRLVGWGSLADWDVDHAHLTKELVELTDDELLAKLSEARANHKGCPWVEDY